MTLGWNLEIEGKIGLDVLEETSWGDIPICSSIAKLPIAERYSIKRLKWNLDTGNFRLRLPPRFFKEFKPFTTSKA